MKRNFTRSLEAVLKEEGGYSNHPKDPGGATNLGVTQRVYDAWLKNNGKAPRSVREITRAEVESIYYQQYWLAARGDQLPDGVDLAMFDYAVNSGPSRAIKDLQRALGVKVDGLIGNVTLAAVAAADPIKLVHDILDTRVRFLKGLSAWSTFGRGWSIRVSRVRAQAVEMARTAPATTAPSPTLPQPKPSIEALPRKENWTIGQVMAWIVGALLAGFAAYAGFGR